MEGQHHSSPTIMKSATTQKQDKNHDDASILSSELELAETKTEPTVDGSSSGCKCCSTIDKEINMMESMQKRLQSDFEEMDLDDEEEDSDMEEELEIFGNRPPPANHYIPSQFYPGRGQHASGQAQSAIYEIVAPMQAQRSYQRYSAYDSTLYKFDL